MSESGVYRIELHPGLLGEVAETFEWYEQQAPGVGHDFNRVFYAAVTNAARQPTLARRMRAGFQRARLRRFPYAIYYRVEGNVVFPSFFFTAHADPSFCSSYFVLEATTLGLDGDVAEKGKGLK